MQMQLVKNNFSMMQRLKLKISNIKKKLNK